MSLPFILLLWGKGLHSENSWNSSFLHCSISPLMQIDTILHQKDQFFILEYLLTQSANKMHTTYVDISARINDWYNFENNKFWV